MFILYNLYITLWSLNCAYSRVSRFSVSARDKTFPFSVGRVYLWSSLRVWCRCSRPCTLSGHTPRTPEHTHRQHREEDAVMLRVSPCAVFSLIIMFMSAVHCMLLLLRWADYGVRLKPADSCVITHPAVTVFHYHVITHSVFWCLYQCIRIKSGLLAAKCFIVSTLKYPLCLCAELVGHIWFYDLHVAAFAWFSQLFPRRKELKDGLGICIPLHW